MIKRPFTPATLVLISSLLATAPLSAQADWPGDKPLTFIVPFSAGSGTDVISRAMADKLGEALGQSIIIENRPGAGGTLGAANVAKANPDGYTWLVHSSGHVVNPAIYPNIPYDTLKDFIGITPLASLPNVLVTSPAKGYKDVGDLVAKAKADPGGLSYASAGNGSATHMNAEQFRVAAGVDALHVPFRGTPPAMNEAVAGRVDWFFAPLVSALPLIQAGQLQALAVGTESRSPALPDVPSIVDVNLPDAAYTFWVGLFTRAGTPSAIVERMHQETVKVLNLPDIQERFKSMGADPYWMEQAEFAAMLERETVASAELVMTAGVKID